MANKECDEYNNKCMRRDDNKGHAYGRVDGKYLDGGHPRGGGQKSTWQTEENAIFYAAVEVDLKHIYNVLGIGDSGLRTPYEDLSPAIEERSVRVVTDYKGNRPIGKEIIYLSTED